MCSAPNNRSVRNHPSSPGQGRPLGSDRFSLHTGSCGANAKQEVSSVFFCLFFHVSDTEWKTNAIKRTRPDDGPVPYPLQAA